MASNPQSPWLVAVDMSSQQGSLSLFKREGGTLTLVEERVLGGAMKHSEEFFGALQSLLEMRRLMPADISEWRTNRGPGSFTGLRIALAAIKGICSATGARLVLCDGAEARALSYLRAHPLPSRAKRPIVIRVCTQSTATKHIVQSYRWDGTRLEPTEQTFVEDIPTSEDGSIVLGDAPHPRVIHWPSRSSHLPFCSRFEVLEGEKALGAAAPTYFASREFVKAAR